MFQTYAAVGSVLLILGIVYMYLFVRLLIGDKKNSQKILALSEAIVTVFIGIFYIYSAIILSGDSDKLGESTHFTNSIDTVTMENYTSDNIQPIQLQISSDIEVTTENKATTNQRMIFDDILVTNLTEVTTEQNVTEELPETTSNKPAEKILAVQDKADQFLQKYQSFIREMMKDKLKNESSPAVNQTYPNLERGQSKVREKREIQLEEEKQSNCYNEFFLHNALLIYSFIQCLITVVNNTLKCQECIKHHKGAQDQKETVSNQKDWTNSSSIDIQREKNGNSAPIGPFFEKDKSEPQNIPNLNQFEAGSKDMSSEDIKVEKYETELKPDTVPQHVKLTLQVILTYLLPLLGIVVLYSITNNETIKAAELNFTTTPDSNILTRIQAPVNITNTESLEVDRVIKNVYEIVNQARENSTKKTTYFSPLMVETLYFMKPSRRNPKAKTEKCPTIDPYIKTYYFFIFIASYFATILYAKVIHIDAKSTGIQRAKEQNVSLLTFSTLWLPSVLDIFFRMFVSQKRATVLSDLFLALGNINRIYTMASNHIQCKKYVSKKNIIKPEAF